RACPWLLLCTLTNKAGTNETSTVARLVERPGGITLVLYPAGDTSLGSSSRLFYRRSLVDFGQTSDPLHTCRELPGGARRVSFRKLIAFRADRHPEVGQPARHSPGTRALGWCELLHARAPVQLSTVLLNGCIDLPTNGQRRRWRADFKSSWALNL